MAELLGYESGGMRILSHRCGGSCTAADNEHSVPSVPVATDGAGPRSARREDIGRFGYLSHPRSAALCISLGEFQGMHDSFIKHDESVATGLVRSSMTPSATVRQT